MLLFSVLFNCLVFYVVDCSNQLHRLAYNHMFFYMLVEIFLLLTISESTDIGCAPAAAGIKRPGKMAIGRGIELDVDTRVFR